MKKTLLLLFVLSVILQQANSQELYVYSEPASNVPAKSLGFKLTGRFPAQGNNLQRYMPEVRVGINKNWMVNVSSTFSNYYSSNLRYESVKAYTKYRFYSNDDVHRHFRMAAFADVAFTRSPYTYDEINLEGDNNGAQIGLIATQLVHKLAVSGTVAYTGLFNADGKQAQHVGKSSMNALNYSLSAGYLLFPKEYVDYKQTNLNLYVEMLGMRSLDTKHYGMDIAPALQLIFNSNTKVNVGYRFQAGGNMHRMATKTWQVSLEHTLFNAWK